METLGIEWPRNDWLEAMKYQLSIWLEAMKYKRSIWVEAIGLLFIQAASQGNNGVYESAHGFQQSTESIPYQIPNQMSVVSASTFYHCSSYRAAQTTSGLDQSTSWIQLLHFHVEQCNTTANAEFTRIVFENGSASKIGANTPDEAQLELPISQQCKNPLQCTSAPACGVKNSVQTFLNIAGHITMVNTAYITYDQTPTRTFSNSNNHYDLYENEPFKTCYPSPLRLRCEPTSPHSRGLLKPRIHTIIEGLLLPIFTFLPEKIH